MDKSIWEWREGLFSRTDWVASGFISAVGAGLSGYSIGETIDSYYYGYVTYRQKYGK